MQFNLIHLSFSINIKSLLTLRNKSSLKTQMILSDNQKRKDLKQKQEKNQGKNQKYQERDSIQKFNTKGKRINSIVLERNQRINSSSQKKNTKNKNLKRIRLIFLQIIVKNSQRIIYSLMAFNHQACHRQFQSAQVEDTYR